MAQVESRDAPQPLGPADKTIFALMGVAPALLALASWDPHVRILYPSQGLVRSLSLPVTLIELVVIGFAIMVGRGPSRPIAGLPLWAKILLGTLVVIALATAVTVAVSPPTALLRTYAWIVHLLFGFSVWQLLDSRWSELRPLIWPTAIIGVLLYILILAAFVLAVGNNADFPWRTLGLGVTHVRQTGFYSVVGGAAAIGLAATARSAGRYWLAVGAASLCFALSYWSGTRGSVIAVLVAFAVGLSLLPGLRSLRAVGALVLANAAGALASLVHQVPHSFYGIFRIARSTAVGDANEMASGRLDQWRLSAEAVLERPLFGFGESQYAIAVPAFRDFNHPHNIVLQAALSWGLVGLVCFLALAGALLWKSVAASRAGGDETIPAFLVATGLATMALYEGSLYHPYPVMMVTVASAVVLSARRPTLAAHGPVPDPVTPRQGVA